MNPAKRQEKLQQARQACERGDASGAERICQALLRASPGDAQALHLLGFIAASRQDYPTATKHLSRAAAIDARNAQFHNDLARVHALSGRYVAAVASLERAQALQPGNANTQIVTDLADVLERSGQFPRAQALLDPFLRAGAVNEDMAPIVMRLLDHAGDTEQAIHLARQQLAAPSRDEMRRRFLLQLLGRLCDKTGDYRGAFEAFAAAKQSERHRFVPDDYARQVDALIAAFSKETLARLPRASPASQLPVFIACMPRSGSTLVEQVIHAHPKAHGGGEDPLLHRLISTLAQEPGASLPYPQRVARLDAAALDRLAAPCLRAMADAAPGALRVTNKHLLNYVNLGMVALLFPGARVIHIRRDRLDNGLACFMTSLSPAVMPWATDLRHIGFAWRQYERLMAHWREALGLNVLEVQYEDLVNDIETQARRIIEFCGLEWDERCLRFWEAERVVLTPSYDQVRRPIFRSAVDRWRRYEEFLGPLKEALGED